VVYWRVEIKKATLKRQKRVADVNRIIEEKRNAQPE
jgi:hypothetical protein